MFVETEISCNVGYSVARFATLDKRLKKRSNCYERHLNIKGSCCFVSVPRSDLQRNIKAVGLGCITLPTKQLIEYLVAPEKRHRGFILRWQKA